MSRKEGGGRSVRGQCFRHRDRAERQSGCQQLGMYSQATGNTLIRIRDEEWDGDKENDT